jgi:hypothetical protein
MDLIISLWDRTTWEATEATLSGGRCRFVTVRIFAAREGRASRRLSPIKDTGVVATTRYPQKLWISPRRIGAILQNLAARIGAA